MTLLAWRARLRLHELARYLPSARGLPLAGSLLAVGLTAAVTRGVGGLSN